MSAEANRDFATNVGTQGLVHAVGGNTRPNFGGSVDSTSRAVTAPAGVVEFIPTEMIVRVGAGTLVSDLGAELAERGQFVALPARDASTVGGTLAVGSSGLLQLGYGLVRDTLLEAQYVTADGDLVRAGAPVVKNVSGFDICRLLVGSLGTFGLMAEVVLRTRPIPARRVWLVGSVGHREVLELLRLPTSLISSGETCWVKIEGHSSDVERTTGELSGIGMKECSGPPAVGEYRRSVTLGQEVDSLVDAEHALVGTGTILSHQVQPIPVVSAGEARLSQAIRSTYDPDARFNQGRQPWQSEQGEVT